MPAQYELPAANELRGSLEKGIQDFVQSNQLPKAALDTLTDRLKSIL